MTGVQLCACGCGEPAPIAKRTRGRLGHVKGEPIKFRQGHGCRSHPHGYTEDPKTGCWNWNGEKHRTWGYGRIWRNGVRKHAHVVFYEDRYGPVSAGHHVHHACENPACVNPDHLEALVPLEHRRQHGKLRDALPRLRALREAGWSQQRIADDLGVSQQSVSAVLRGHTW